MKISYNNSTLLFLLPLLPSLLLLMSTVHAFDFPTSPPQAFHFLLTSEPPLNVNLTQLNAGVHFYRKRLRCDTLLTFDASNRRAARVPRTHVKKREPGMRERLLGGCVLGGRFPDLQHELRWMWHGRMGIGEPEQEVRFVSALRRVQS